MDLAMPRGPPHNELVVSSEAGPSLTAALLAPIYRARVVAQVEELTGSTGAGRSPGDLHVQRLGLLKRSESQRLWRRG